jgi:hypothetical protein
MNNRNETLENNVDVMLTSTLKHISDVCTEIEKKNENLDSIFLKKALTEFVIQVRKKKDEIDELRKDKNFGSLNYYIQSLIYLTKTISEKIEKEEGDYSRIKGELYILNDYLIKSLQNIQEAIQD